MESLTTNIMTANEESVEALHLELIEYASESYRFMFIENETSFAEFRPSGESFCDLTPRQFCEILLYDVLPKVHSYKISEQMEKRLRLLNLHPGFSETPEGYQYKELDDFFVLKPNRDFSRASRLPDLIKASSEDKQEPVLPLEGQKDASHTIFSESCDTATYNCPKLQLSSDIRVHLSAMLSSDKELSTAQLFSTPEIKRRMQIAKQGFEDRGHVLPYRDDSDKTKNCIGIFDRLEKKLCRTFSTIYK